nr:UDP-glucuronosyltransferase 2C1-like [Solea senegalensis]
MKHVLFPVWTNSRCLTMVRLICCCSALLLLTLVPGVCQAGNILVFPIEGSHWINMEIMLQALHARGHNLTVLRLSKSWYVKGNSSYYNTINVQVEKSINQEVITDFLAVVLEYEKGTLPWFNFLSVNIGMIGTFIDIHRITSGFVSAMIDDQGLIRTIKDSKFDLMLTDPAWASGAILAKYLNLPLVYNVRWLLAVDAQFAIAPSPLSYVPTVGSGNTDKMNFLQRVKNMLIHLVTQSQTYLVSELAYQETVDKYLGPGNSLHQLILNADIWLMRTDFIFDYPRPTLPNVVYMGGFQCKPAKPLPEHLEEFVQSSGEHGFIIMSLGTFVSELPPDMTSEIASAFAKLPQKVIWKHKGTRPATLGNNTLLVDWMPQNDLLGHPKIKLFVAHGGTNGVQEALYHGVPVVGLPVFFDQYDNLLRLRDRGAAKTLTLATMNKDSFLEAIEEVLKDPSYRTNMQRLSRLHRDKPMKPMDTAIFWIEFVMRHKGAPHLRAQSYRLPWYSYHSVDVFLFLSGAVLLVLFTVFILMRCLYTAVRKPKVKKE